MFYRLSPLSVAIGAICKCVTVLDTIFLSFQVLDIVYFSNTTTPGGFLPQGATGMSPILFRR